MQPTGNCPRSGPASFLRSSEYHRHRGRIAKNRTLRCLVSQDAVASASVIVRQLHIALGGNTSKFQIERAQERNLSTDFLETKILSFEEPDPIEHRD